MKESYVFTSQDKKIIDSTKLLLRKIIASPFVNSAQVVSIGKILHVISNLPRYTSDVAASLILSGPRRKFGEHEIWHSWQILVEDGYIAVSSGGSFYRPSTGSDGFTCMTWSASVGNECEYNDHLDQLRIVDDALPYDTEVERLNLSEGKYVLELYDDANPFLGDEEGIDQEEDELHEEQNEETDLEDQEDKEEEENDENDWADAEPVSSSDPKEAKLDSVSDLKEGYSRKMFGYFSYNNCDICGIDLSTKKYFIDGKVKTEFVWALMCANCFEKEGEAIRWGKGQLYTQLTNGKWLLTAGFPPEE